MRDKGRIRWFTIGRHGQPWTPDTARNKALQILADPSSVEEKAFNKNIKFADFADQFFKTYGSTLKGRSLEEYKRLNRLYLQPAFSKYSPDSITHADVSRFHAKWRDVPRAANYALAVLSKMMSWGEKQGYRDVDTNPCRGVARYKETKRECYLQPAELSRLGNVLTKVERQGLVDPYAVAAIRLLLFTGARLNEILTLKWSYVDIERSALFLPDSKTGRKTILLNDFAIAVLNGLPRLSDNPYVIVGRCAGAHLVNLQ